MFTGRSAIGKINLHWNCPSVRAVPERQERVEDAAEHWGPAIKHFPEKVETGSVRS